MRLALPLAALLAVSPLAACGGATAPSAGATGPAASADATGATSATAQTAPTASAAPTAVEIDEPDPTESPDPIALEVVLPPGTKKADFPRASTTDGECWRTANLLGKHDKDFAALLEKCGTPTGLREYVRPVSGHLHHKTDKRDTFSIKLRGGYCYRYFAVGDASTEDIDILITTPTGAMIATDHGDGPAAIIENEKPWCASEDVEYQLHVEVDGTGKGRYTFGVWARPK